MKPLRLIFLIGVLLITVATGPVACRGRGQPTAPPPAPSVLAPPTPQTPRATLPPATSPPAAPSNLRAAEVKQTEIVVTWQDNSDNEAGFRIYLAGTDIVARVGPNVTRAVLGNLTCNVQYQYTVRAGNAAGESAPSNAIDVTTAPCQ